MKQGNAKEPHHCGRMATTRNEVGYPLPHVLICSLSEDLVDDVKHRREKPVAAHWPRDSFFEHYVQEMSPLRGGNCDVMRSSVDPDTPTSLIHDMVSSTVAVLTHTSVLNLTLQH